LKAIEADDRKALPSGFFYRSFVDQYAQFLGLDVREINAEVERILSADAPLPLPGYETVLTKNVPSLKTPRRRGWLSSVALITVAAGCSGVYALWHDAKLESLTKLIKRTVPSSQSRDNSARLQPSKPQAVPTLSVAPVSATPAPAPPDR